MSWVSSATKTGPTKNTILADTGALLAGTGTMTLIITSNASGIVFFEKVDSITEAILNSHPLPINGREIFTLSLPITFIANDRYRLRVDSGLEATTTGSIIT